MFTNNGYFYDIDENYLIVDLKIIFIIIKRQKYIST